MTPEDRWSYHPPEPEPNPDYVNIFIFGAVAAVSAAIVTAFLRTVGFEVLDIPRTFEPLESGSTVAGVAVGAVIGATVVYTWLAARLPDPRPRFYTIAAAILILSFIPLLLVAIAGEDRVDGFSWTAIGLLALMHIAVAFSCVTLLPHAQPDDTDY